MRRIIFLIILIPTMLTAEVPEWKAEVLIKANYGGNLDEYGFKDIVEKQDTSPVGAFYVDEYYIYINDIFQGNIKIYDITGDYVRSIYCTTRSVYSILVLNDILYLLCYNGGIPPEDQSAVYILTYNIITNGFGDRINIFNPEVSRKTGRTSYVYGAASLQIGPDDSVWLYDGAHDTSFPLVLHGQRTPDSAHRQGVPGRMFESIRVVLNKETHRRKMLDKEGSFIRDLDAANSFNRINFKNSSKNGRYFVRHHLFKADFIIMTWDGRDLGRARWEHKESWNTYPINNLILVGPDGSFYRVNAEYDGVYLYRWSGKE